MALGAEWIIARGHDQPGFNRLECRLRQPHHQPEPHRVGSADGRGTALLPFARAWAVSAIFRLMNPRSTSQEPAKEVAKKSDRTEKQKREHRPMTTINRIPTLNRSVNFL